MKCSVKSFALFILLWIIGCHPPFLHTVRILPSSFITAASKLQSWSEGDLSGIHKCGKHFSTSVLATVEDLRPFVGMDIVNLVMTFSIPPASFSNIMNSIATTSRSLMRISDQLGPLPLVVGVCSCYTSGSFHITSPLWMAPWGFQNHVMALTAGTSGAWRN